jgi:hypothetical protein
VLELCILRSLAFLRRGDTQKAQADLARALSMAEPEGYVRIFLDEGPPMQTLISQWLIHASAGPLKDYATWLLSQFNAEPQLATLTSAAGDLSVSYEVSLVEPLSQRELKSSASSPWAEPTRRSPSNSLFRQVLSKPTLPVFIASSTSPTGLRRRHAPGRLASFPKKPCG